jgi:uncharacterized protein YbdZ (MbtH family)
MSTTKTIQDDFVTEETEQTGGVTAVAAPTEPQKAKAGTERKGASSARPKSEEAFDPTQYLSNFDGRDYLEVKWRVMWLRHEHPEALMTTEAVQLNEEGGFALFRAEVEIPGGGKATGWGSETVRDFHDYIEAAETKALGRALAALGYGTQFCRDFDFAANARPGTNQVVDAPVRMAEPRTITSHTNQTSHPAPFNPKANSFGGNSTSNDNGKSGSFGNSGFARIDGGRLPAQEDDFDRIPEITPAGSALTEKQLKAIYAIGRANMRLSEQQVDDRCAEVFGIRPTELTKAEASQFIDMLKGEAA